MDKVLNFKYWFSARPQALSPTVLTYFIIFIASLAVFTFIFYLIKTRKKSLYTRIWNKLYLFSLTNFILGLFFLFFNHELIPFLSTRILLVIWVISMIVWLVFILRSFVEIPKIKEEKAKEEEFNKYIP